MLKCATWNVNGVRARIEFVSDWLRRTAPDCVCLQETKVVDDLFPREAFEDLGYNVAVHGQKTFNGVAILSKYPFDEVIPTLPGCDDDQQSRYLETVFSVNGRAVRLASLYLPNGNPVDSDKFTYKIAWMDRLYQRMRDLLTYEEIVLLGGDYNVIPDPQDVYDPDAWAGDALFHPDIRNRFQAMLNLGYTDALRACCDAKEIYTFWDYKAGAWQHNRRLRIDHILLSPQAADVLIGVDIAKDVRGSEKPSDHVPVVAILDLSGCSLSSEKSSS